MRSSESKPNSSHITLKAFPKKKKPYRYVGLLSVSYRVLLFLSGCVRMHVHASGHVSRPAGYLRVSKSRGGWAQRSL